MVWGTCLKLVAGGKVKSVGRGLLLGVGELKETKNIFEEKRIFNGTVTIVE